MDRKKTSLTVASSTIGNWTAWFVDSSFPKGFRVLAYLMLSSIQYSAAPSELKSRSLELVFHRQETWSKNWRAKKLWTYLAACRSRFSCTKVCAIANPWPMTPKMEVFGTKTSVKVNARLINQLLNRDRDEETEGHLSLAWSVGMLNVHS